MESVETRVIPNHGQRRELQRDWRKETEGERREKEEEANLRGRNERRFWRDRGSERRRGSVERQDEATAWEGTRRRVERSFWPAYGIYESPGVPATSQEFPKWQSRHHLPFLSHPVLPISPPLFNLLSSLQAPLHLCALYIHPASIAVLRCCTLFTPLRGALLSFDGESERSYVSWRLPRRLTGTSNRNFNAYTCACIPCVCMRVSEFTSLKIVEIRDVRYVCIKIYFWRK